MFNLFNDGTNNKSVLDAACAQIDNAISDSALGNSKALSTLTEGVLAGESFAEQAVNLNKSEHADGRQTIEEVLSVIEHDKALLAKLGVDSLTDAQKNAAALALMASSNPKEYQKLLAGMGEVHGNFENVQSLDLGEYNAFASFGSASEIMAGESFENVNLYGIQSVNVIASIRQAKLSAFSEMFAPTVAVPPSKQSIALTVRIPLIQRAARHALNGTGIDRGRMSLIAAKYDSRILDNETTSVVVVRREGGSAAEMNTSFLATTDVVPVRRVQHNGTYVDTSPILTGKNVDVLGLNSTVGINGIVEDETATLTASAKVRTLYIYVTDGSTTEAIPVDVKDMPGFQFNRAGNQSNDKMGMSFNYQTEQFPLGDYDQENDSVVYRTAKGEDSTLLAALTSAGIALNLHVIVSGQLNLETGKSIVINGLTEVSDAKDAEGTIYSPTDEVIQTAVKDLTFTIGAWYPDMATTNTNWAREGKQVNYNEYTYPYAIRTLSPFTTKIPTDEEPSADQVNDLSAAVTQQADNNVALSLLSYVDVVRRAALSHTTFHDEPGTLGAGWHLLRQPYYKRVDIDAINDINSTETAEKIADFNALLTDTLRNECAIADQTAGIQGGIDTLTGNSGKRPTVKVGTDLLLKQNIFESGEPRTLANYSDFQIEANNLNEYLGRCVVMMGLDGNPGENPLATGQRWYTPDVIRTATISGDTTTKRVMIIPHYTIVFNVPVIIDVHVSNLAELFTGSTYQPVSGIAGEDIAIINNTPAADDGEDPVDPVDPVEGE